MAYATRKCLQGSDLGGARDATVPPGVGSRWRTRSERASRGGISGRVRDPKATPRVGSRWRTRPESASEGGVSMAYATRKCLRGSDPGDRRRCGWGPRVRRKERERERDGARTLMLPRNEDDCHALALALALAPRVRRRCRCRCRRRRRRRCRRRCRSSCSPLAFGSLAFGPRRRRAAAHFTGQGTSTSPQPSDQATMQSYISTGSVLARHPSKYEGGLRICRLVV